MRIGWNKESIFPLFQLIFIKQTQSKRQKTL